MKRMSDVFFMPMSYSDAEELTLNCIDEEVEAIQHAINHVDALADALESLLDAVTNRSAHDSINNQIISAAMALGDYRGEK